MSIVDKSAKNKQDEPNLKQELTIPEETKKGTPGQKSSRSQNVPNNPDQSSPKKKQTLKERLGRAIIEKNKEFAAAGITFKKKLTFKERLRKALIKKFEEELTKYVKKQIVMAL